MWAIEGITLQPDMFVAKRRRLRKLPPQPFREGCEGRDVRHRQKIVRPPELSFSTGLQCFLCCCPEKHPLQKTCVFGTLEIELSGRVQSVDCGGSSKGFLEPGIRNRFTIRFYSLYRFG